MERRLAAILVADVVDYSRAMGVDEAGTLQLLKAHRRELLEPKAARFGGRIIKLMGDGMLMEFASVVDAVAYAVDVQLAMRKRNAVLAEDKRLLLRIGINLGDVILDGDDIYGDGVNIAARLEKLAEPGGICVRRNVRNQVRDKLPLDFEDLGEIEVKNIERPIRVFRIALNEKAALVVSTDSAGPSRRSSRKYLAFALAMGSILFAVGFYWWSLSRPEFEPASVDQMVFALPDKPSIAVLPFSNVGGDDDNEYFADGITNDLITDLSRFSNLFVIAANSSFAYKGKPVKVQEVAEDLGVRFIIEGSVQRSGEEIRINAQLIDALSGHHVWAERFDRPAAEINVLADELLEKIVSRVSSRVDDVGRRLAGRKPTESLNAYELVLQGEALLDDYTSVGNEEARNKFQKATALDAQYARAFVGLSITYLREFLFGWSADGAASLAQGREIALKAVELDENDSKTHHNLGWAYLFEGQYGKALSELEKGQSLNPNDASILAENGYMLIYLGKIQEAADQIQRAIRLDPHHPDWYFDALGWAYFFLGKYEDALRTTSRISVPASGQHRLLAAIYVRLGDNEKAKEHAAKVMELEPDFEVDIFARTMPFKDRSILEDYLSALRNAGLP